MISAGTGMGSGPCLVLTGDDLDKVKEAKLRRGV